MSESETNTNPGQDTALATQAEPKRVLAPSRWGIPTDTVVRVTESLPEDHRQELRWLQRFGAHGNYSRAELAEMLRKPNGEPYSGDTLYAALTGRRTEQGSSLQPLIDAIRIFRRRQEETTAARSTDFIQTRVSRRIWSICDRARDKGRLAFVFGPTQVGKSVILDEYARTHNHGSTVSVRMPTRGALTQFTAELSSGLRLPRVLREHEARRRIFDSFDPSTLLIVDEAHQCLIGRADTGGLTLEFIRELHDRRKCGVVICGTEVLASGLRNNPVLRQLWQRRSSSLVINLGRKSYDHGELAEFSRSFGLDPAPDREIAVSYTTDGPDGQEQTHRIKENPFQLQERIVREDSLGAWCKILEDAKDMAALDGGRMTWGRVITSWCIGLAAQTAEGGAL